MIECKMRSNITANKMHSIHQYCECRVAQLNNVMLLDERKATLDNFHSTTSLLNRDERKYQIIGLMH